MKRFFVTALIVLLSFNTGTVLAQATAFTQDDRERLIRVETTLNLFMQTTDKRFSELREDMNKRFEQVDKRFEQVDKRFEQVDKRFEQVNQQFQQMIAMIQILAAIFTTLTLGVIGFAYWDRRTILQKAKADTREIVAQNQTVLEHTMTEQITAQTRQISEQNNRLADIIATLRYLSRNDPPLAEALRNFHLL